MQLILDELAAGLAKGRVKGDAAAAYLGALLSKEAKGELELSAAYDWQARRMAKLAKQAAPEKPLDSGASLAQPYRDSHRQLHSRF
ncbi:hypothetical protein RZS08_52190, partial [Arthrospira platensis SPKY1]|nr:hypothetical protein [Arthrospira platensis SPKY1]